MAKEDTVILSKSRLEALLDELKKLRVKVDRLEQEKLVVEQRARQRQRPILHSLSTAREEAMERQYRIEREAIKSPEVQKAIDLLIMYYFTNPPQHRRPEVEEILSQKTIAQIIRDSKKDQY